MKVICPKFNKCNVSIASRSSHCFPHDVKKACDSECTGQGQFDGYKTAPCIEFTNQMNAILVLRKLKDPI